MESAGAEPEKPEDIVEKPRRARAMALWSRWVLGIAGLGMLGVGGYAVLTADNELGSVAVVLVGSLFIAASSMGHWPNRLAWGDKSVEWYEEVLENVLTTASPETRAEVSEIVESTPSPDARKRAVDRIVLSQGRWNDESLLSRMATRDRQVAISNDIHRLSSIVPADVAVSAPASGSGRSIDAQIARRGERDPARSVGVYVMSSATAVNNMRIWAAGSQSLEQGFGAAIVVVPDRHRISMGSLGDGQRRVFVIDLDDTEHAATMIKEALEVAASD